MSGLAWLQTTILLAAIPAALVKAGLPIAGGVLKDKIDRARLVAGRATKAYLSMGG
jgi:hypothetical protein